MSLGVYLGLQRHRLHVILLPADPITMSTWLGILVVVADNRTLPAGRRFCIAHHYQVVGHRCPLSRSPPQNYSLADSSCSAERLAQMAGILIYQPSGNGDRRRHPAARSTESHCGRTCRGGAGGVMMSD